MGDIRLNPAWYFFTHKIPHGSQIPPQLEHANGHKDQSEFLLGRYCLSLPNTAQSHSHPAGYFQSNFLVQSDSPIESSYFPADGFWFNDHIRLQLHSVINCDASGSISVTPAVIPLTSPALQNFVCRCQLLPVIDTEYFLVIFDINSHH